MGVQGNAERGEKSRNTRLIFLLVYLVLRLSVASSAQQLYEVERAIRAKEREEARWAGRSGTAIRSSTQVPIT